ncbi:MAG: response regulator, partial [Tepidimonas taiwanensis]|nr:response regulator [Tepidimonas taiwanensis]
MTPRDTPTLLIVEDEPDLRQLYELALVKVGLAVDAAGDLTQARAHLARRRYSAVVTDMRLPDGTGLDLLRDLVRDGHEERPIVITAYGAADKAVEALKAGAFDYLTKPVAPTLLTAPMAKRPCRAHSWKPCCSATAGTSRAPRASWAGPWPNCAIGCSAWGWGDHRLACAP